MTRLLIRLFIKDPAGAEADHSRSACGVLSGGVGIVCNLLLSGLKFLIGSLTGSIAITADAANNLSDASSCVVTIVGSRYADKPADKEHPFGHGRVEYLAALAVSFFILLMGGELLRSSVRKIISPEEITFSWLLFGVLCLAIPVKLWMAYFNRQLYKMTGALTLKAVVRDSLNDCIATGAALAALLIGGFTSFQADGYIGVAVSAVILYSGFSMLREIIAPLLGKAPDKALVRQLEETILSFDRILGVHDLIVHDYGPGRTIVSAHAEVPADGDIMELHDVIDRIEHKIKQDLNITAVLHMDPVVVNDARVDALQALTADILRQTDPALRFHDFRVVFGTNYTKLMFDLVYPYQYDKTAAQLEALLTEKFRQIDPDYQLVIQMEHSYTEE